MIPNFTFSSKDQASKDATTKCVEKGLIYGNGLGTGPQPILLSLFGYNKGAQQWLQLFDSVSAPSSGDEPVHTFGIAAADNFSVIVPQSGINFTNGIYFALSSTQGKYTGTGVKDVTFCGTLRA